MFQNAALLDIAEIDAGRIKADHAFIVWCADRVGFNHFFGFNHRFSRIYRFDLLLRRSILIACNRHRGNGQSRKRKAGQA